MAAKAAPGFSARAKATPRAEESSVVTRKKEQGPGAQTAERARVQTGCTSDQAAHHQRQDDHLQQTQQQLSREGESGKARVAQRLSTARRRDPQT